MHHTSARQLILLCVRYALVALFALLTVAVPGSASASDSVAQFIYPIDGAADVDLSQPFAWTPVDNVQAYYVYVGTTLGAKDIVNSGELAQTSYLVPNTVPSGQTLYGRLWTKAGGIWRFVDISFVVAASPVAQFIYPSNGSMVAPAQSFAWTTVANAQAYYLYVGTSHGTRDVVNTGEILTTSYSMYNLPSGRILYARLWTKWSGVWRYADVSFTTADQTAARFIFPSDGLTNIALPLDFTWTSVSGATCYYLYVGSSLGTNDLVNSGEIQATTYRVSALPSGRTLYGRIWTKKAGMWSHNDVTFTVAALPIAQLISPADGATSVALSPEMTWTSVDNAQAYYVYVGTSQGANNIVNSGELQQTSYRPSSLPPAATLYVRMWTKVAGVWRSADSTFTTTPLAATFIYPTNGATNVDLTEPISWSEAPNAEAYFLWIGATPGGNDLLQFGETLDTAYDVANLPSGTTLYARLWTKAADTWVYSDITFSAAASAAAFVYPAHGDVDVDPNRQIEWTTIPNAEYFLDIGTSAGGENLVNSGALQQTTYPLANLPSDGPLYVRLWTRLGDEWGYSDIVFTIADAVQGASMAYPVDGATNVDAGQPFRWTSVGVATAYRLEIGYATGTNDLHDSGAISVTRRFVPNLPIGVPLYGRLQTQIDGVWQAAQFSFTVTSNISSMTRKIDSALWATHFVREMADVRNRAFTWNALWDMTFSRGSVLCSDYAQMLLYILAEINVGTEARILNIGLNRDGYDAHTLVELLDTDTQRWLILDPTFDLAAKLASDGRWATAEDIRNATLAQAWSSISYQFLGPQGDRDARAYYVDYPLLYLNIPNGSQSPLSYLDEVGTTVAGGYKIYLVRCEGQSQVLATIDGTQTEVPCGGFDELSAAFWASSIAPVNGGGTFRVYKPKRFVF